MGKIDKEKAIGIIKKLGFSDAINEIQNFPEEPETAIDFDALKEECLEGSNDLSIACGINRFCKFLKSKNLTVPVAPVKPELPVKTEWVMKQEHVQLFKDFGFDNARHWSLDIPPADKVKKYYEPVNITDYSKIPVGTAVCIYAHGVLACGFVSTPAHPGEIRLLFRVDGCQHYTVGTRDIESLEILKEAPNGQK